MTRGSAFRAIFLLVALALVLAPQAPTAAQQPRRGGALRIAHIGEPPTLDLHMTTAAITGHIMYNVYEGLFALNSKFEPKPLLVEKWSMSGDRLGYTFTLRRGIKFHHGRDLTSDDVKASLERWGRLAANGRALFANVASLTTPDPLTVAIRLKEPNALRHQGAPRPLAAHAETLVRGSRVDQVRRLLPAPPPAQGTQGI